MSNTDRTGWRNRAIRTRRRGNRVVIDNKTRINRMIRRNIRERV